MNQTLKELYPLIAELDELLLEEYPNTIRSINQTADKLELGTGSLLLKSIYNHHSSLKILLEGHFLESAGSVLTSLWEKSIMVQYLVLDLTERVHKYSSHQTFKKLPWSVKTMVEGISRSEKIGPDKKMQNHIDLFYMQYSFLCAIKHGNPYTLTRINRVSDNEDFFEPNPRLNEKEQDTLGYLWLLSITTFFDALQAYARALCTKSQFLKLDLINKKITYDYMPKIMLDVPQIIQPSTDDFSVEFWDLLENLHNQKYGNNKSANTSGS